MRHNRISPVEEVNQFMMPDTIMDDFRCRLRKAICQLSIVRTRTEDVYYNKTIDDAVMLMSELCIEFDTLDSEVKQFLSKMQNAEI